jgi:predicted transcriptional regulator
MSKTPNAMHVMDVRISPQADALDRFEAAWHLATGRPAPEPLRLLSFPDLPGLLKSLTPARWEMLQHLRREGPLSVLALARALGRDYKNVHTDVARFVEMGLVGKRDDGKVEVTWEAVRMELKL